MKKLLVLLFFVTPLALGATYPTPAKWSDVTDSVRMYFLKNQIKVDSGKRTAVQSYDTTYTVNNDTTYTVIYKIYFAGQDSAVSWPWQYRNGGIGNGQWFREYDWGFPVDSGRDRIYDGNTVVNNTAIPSTAQSYIDTYTVLDDKSYLGSLTLYPTGFDSPMVWAWPTNTRTSTGLIFPDTGTYICNVYGYVTYVSGGVAPYSDVTFTLTRTVNNSCNNTIVGGFSKTVRTTALGYFSVPLVWSSCLGDTTAYVVKAKTALGSTREKRIIVPSQSSWQLIW